MNSLTSNKINFVTKTIAAVAVMTAAICAGGAQAYDDPPNPFANLAQAQQQVTSYEKADPNGPINLHSTDVDYTVGRLTTVLALTPAQQTTVHQILDSQSKMVTDARSDKQMTRSDRSIRVAAIYRNSLSDLNGTLTTDQLMKSKIIQGEEMTDPDAARADKLFMFDARFASMPAAEAATQWGSSLNLTATQKLALLPTLEDESKSLDAIAADQTLSAEAGRIKSQEVMIATERKIDDQLTAEQKTHLESAMLLGQTPSSANPRTAPAAH